MALSNPTDRRIRCPECPKTFSRRFALKRHAKTHTAQKSQAIKYYCDHQGCDHSFTRQDTLDRHKDTMHGHAKVLCPNCSKPVRKDGLREHRSTAVCRGSSIVVPADMAVGELQKTDSEITAGKGDGGLIVDDGNSRSDNPAQAVQASYPAFSTMEAEKVGPAWMADDICVPGSSPNVPSACFGVAPSEVPRLWWEESASSIRQDTFFLTPVPLLTVPHSPNAVFEPQDPVLNDSWLNEFLHDPAFDGPIFDSRLTSMVETTPPAGYSPQGSKPFFASDVFDSDLLHEDSFAFSPTCIPSSSHYALRTASRWSGIRINELLQHNEPLEYTADDAQSTLGLETLFEELFIGAREVPKIADVPSDNRVQEPTSTGFKRTDASRDKRQVPDRSEKSPWRVVHRIFGRSRR